MRWLTRARGSVRLRITVLAAGLFAVALAVAAVVLLRTLEGDLVADVRSSDDAALQAEATRVMAEGIPAGAVPVAGPTGETFELPAPGAQRIVLFTESGSLGSTGTYEVTYLGARLTADHVGVLGVTGDVDDYSVSTLATGDFLLATASPLDSVRETIEVTKHLLWFGGPALVALVAALAWLLAGRALRPVHAVTARVGAIGSRSLHERVPVPRSSDEIAELATTMNDMLARLETASTTSRRLVADASHELRTPLAVMRAELEVSRSAGVDWHEASDVLLAELDRLQGLVDDLLLLARGDERALAAAAFSIADVARDVGARTRRVPVEVTVGDDVDPVVGDRAAIARAVDHLVANAARHAATQVRTTVAAAGGEVEIVVDDDGPGIPSARRADVVRRFVRLDEGRARDGGGAGLGLAVAADVAAAHGGRLEIDDAPLGGARLRVVLPRSSALTAPGRGTARAAPA